jgi:hypothetical protein
LIALRTGNAPACSASRKGHPFEQFRDNVRGAVVSADVIDRQDVGMIQRGRGVRLLLEAPQAISVSGEGRGQHLDRDIASKTGIARAIDLSHAPGPERSDDFVRSEADTRS